MRPTTVVAVPQVSLTGIKPTGAPHLGNYVGAIRPALQLTESHDEAYYFVADYHALTTERDPALVREYTLQVAAAWLALSRLTSLAKDSRNLANVNALGRERRVGVGPTRKQRTAMQPMPKERGLQATAEEQPPMAATIPKQPSPVLPT